MNLKLAQSLNGLFFCEKIFDWLHRMDVFFKVLFSLIWSRTHVTANCDVMVTTQWWDDACNFNFLSKNMIFSKTLHSKCIKFALRTRPGEFPADSSCRSAPTVNHNMFGAFFYFQVWKAPFTLCNSARCHFKLCSDWSVLWMWVIRQSHCEDLWHCQSFKLRIRWCCHTITATDTNHIFDREATFVRSSSENNDDENKLIPQVY